MIFIFCCMVGEDPRTRELQQSRKVSISNGAYANHDIQTHDYAGAVLYSLLEFEGSIVNSEMRVCHVWWPQTASVHLLPKYRWK